MPTAESTSSPFSWPKTSFTCLKWSRSKSTTPSGREVRSAWATIRFSVSSIERRFGESGEAVGERPRLRQRQVPEVRQHRGRLRHGFLDPPPVLLPERCRALNEHGADHLAADQRRHACGVPGGRAAQLAGEQRLMSVTLVVRLPEPDGEARVGARGLQLEAQSRVGRQLGHRLQPVVAVVPVQHEHVALRERPLQVPLQEVVRLTLVAGDLHHLGELPLRLVVVPLGVDPASLRLPRLRLFEQRAPRAAETDRSDAEQRQRGDREAERCPAGRSEQRRCGMIVDHDDRPVVRVVRGPGEAPERGAMPVDRRRAFRTAGKRHETVVGRPPEATKRQSWIRARCT